MYKFKSYMMAMLAVGSMAFLTSCGDDEEVAPAPNIVFEPSGETATLNAGDPVNLIVAVTSQDPLKSFRAERYILGNGDLLEEVDDFSGSGYTYTLNETVPANAQPGNVIEYRFTATSNNNQTTVKSYTVTVGSAGTISNFTAILMGAQNNTTQGSFLDAHEGEVYKQLEASQTQNQGLIDIVYFHGATNQATLASPDDASFGTGATEINVGVHGWDDRNETRLKKLTNGEATFNAAATAADLEAAFTGSSATAGTKANMLATGNYVAFMTADGKYGIAKIGTITGTTTGTIQLDVKMQD